MMHGKELAALSGREFEIGYINMMVPHHEGATMMAEAIADRAPHGDVRESAAKMKQDQRAEIALLTRYATDVLGVEVDPDERMSMADSMMAELDDAEASRAELMFLLLMREHHEQAIVMGELVPERATSEVLRSQASMMVEMQRAEQARFGTWIERWSGVTPPEPTGKPERAMKLAKDAEIPDTEGS